MSRIPPSLVYLTIYNPTLKPTLLDPENEDAEEQAHVLFYTAREHAVSRDRILRQVGLAKALVNFSELFNGNPCENVRSQGRRMIMYSPEPNFWMHACYEVAKTPRPLPTSAKIKDSSKGKAKAKEPDSSRPNVLYDYHDGSLHDVALRSHLQRGYEDFKLLHGSFTSNLSSVGQEGLELRLERFFTVVAWRWDPEDDSFATHLGVPRHPLHHKLNPILDKFSALLPTELTIFALFPPYVIPPRTQSCPAALMRLILSRIPPTATPAAEQGFLLTLPMPAMPAMNFSLDVKSFKWGLPGVLTFGKANPAPSSPPASLAAVVTPPLETANLQPNPSQKDALDVDRASLLEAISTESIGSYTRAASPAPSALSKSSQLVESTSASGVNTTTFPVETQSTQNEDTQVSSPNPPQSLSLDTASSASSSAFLTTRVHIDSLEDPLVSTTIAVRFLTVWSPPSTSNSSSRGECTVAIVGDNGEDINQRADDVIELMGEMETIVSEQSLTRDSQIPSAAKILQPKDKCIVATGDFSMTGTAPFMSRSEHLYNGQELLQSGLDISEVFSRGQNPQHWYIGRRGLGVAPDGGHIDGEAYMEVARKETTLTDVDNALAGVVRRFADQM
ncbi:uncharacterized protein BXZ73DRAFT_88593 [Epithele typhae]|uniref:uncharacterized protein n=1 Tax=Epithele typhae TaxID=378194 RepID=UPI0020075104|nr:uncharacterized protein BXZ73DRAFT_88593 [Epithele typhae]KAH9940920.1 hypothetical protein BXZ73DRAFT_88593 [Epithele typhae]